MPELLKTPPQSTGPFRLPTVPLPTQSLKNRPTMAAPFLKGIFTPTLVPFFPDGSVNEAELRRMIDWLISKGVHGIYPNGSTGTSLDSSQPSRGSSPDARSLAFSP